MASAQSEISSLCEQINEGCVEKLALKHEIRVLRDNLESCGKDVEELRVEVSRQSDHYNDLWSAHGTSLEEVQMLRSQVIDLRLGVRVENVRGWPVGANRDPEGPSSRPEGSGRQPGRSTDHVKSPGSWHERSQRWSTDQGSGLGGAK